MEPTLENGNYLIISKIDDTLNAITKIFNPKSTQNYKRGEIIVFKAPNTSNVFFIKRIVGLPKERVTIKDGKITIYNKENPQGFVLHEDYIGNQKTEGDIDQIVDDDSVFVLGDNRKHSGSFDSRYFGPIQKDSIVGNATLRLLPINEMNFISTPQYSN
jgi:signal peptidase I